jgi:glutathione S-transferase
LKLFYAEASPYARIVRIALIELGLYDGIEKEIVTLRDPASTLLPHNPVGRVPTLRLDDGTVLSETLLIVPYLDTLHAGPALLPPDGATLSRMGTAMGLIDGIVTWNRELRRPEDQRSPALLALEHTRASRTLDVLEVAVGAGAYSGRIDAARIALGAALAWTERRHRTFPWREGHPLLSAWYDDIAQRPSFTRTLPPVT